MVLRTLSIVAAATCLGLLQACSSLPRQLASPQVELVELRLVQASFDGQRFVVRLLISNPNPLPIPVQFVEFDIRLAGEGLLDGHTLAPFTLPAGGSQAVDVEIFSNLISSASRLLSLVQGPANMLEYEVQGDVTLDTRFRDPLSFYHRGQVPLVLPQ